MKANYSILFEDFYDLSDDKKLKRKWGNTKKFWYLFDNGELIYTENLWIKYSIDLEKYDNNSKLLDDIFQLNNKPYRYCVQYFIQAINDIFNPQANCCSFGENKKFSGKKLVENYLQKLNEQKIFQDYENVIDFFPTHLTKRKKRKCNLCNRIYKFERKDSKFCCDSHRARFSQLKKQDKLESYTTKTIRNCNFCNQLYKFKRSDSKFCSDLCRVKHHHIKKGENNET